MNNQTRSFKHLDTITAMFLAILLISNLLSSAKLVDLGFSLGSISFIFDGGLVVFPICYIFGDILTEVYGFKRSRKVVWLGFIGLIMLSTFILILKSLPGEANWLEGGGQSAYDLVFFGVYSGGLVLASLVAYLAGEFANSICLAKLKVRQGGKNMSLRFVLSTVIGQLVDTSIFFTIAIAFNVFPAELFVELMLTNYLTKVAIEVILLPISVALAKWLKVVENTDVYDKDTKFNPFALNIT